jgi:hypothetical protein
MLMVRWFTSIEALLCLLERNISEGSKGFMNEAEKDLWRYRNEMADLLASGWTLDEVGKRYGTSRQRVHQLLGPVTAYRSKNPTVKDILISHLSDINRLRIEGKTVKEILEALGIPNLCSSSMFNEHLKGRLAPLSLRHGYSTYNHRGCRCEICVSGFKEYQRGQRDKRRTKAEEFAKEWKERNGKERESPS